MTYWQSVCLFVCFWELLCVWRSGVDSSRVPAASLKSAWGVAWRTFIALVAGYGLQAIIGMVAEAVRAVV